jgi:hypothetical protein
VHAPLDEKFLRRRPVDARIQPDGQITRIAAPSFRDGPKDQTSGAQLRTGESLDSGFALRAPRNDSDIVGLILYLGKIRHRPRRGADFIQQLQAIFAHFRVVIVDPNIAEKCIDRGTQFRYRAHCANKILA